MLQLYPEIDESRKVGQKDEIKTAVLFECNFFR